MLFSLLKPIYSARCNLLATAAAFSISRNYVKMSRSVSDLTSTLWLRPWTQTAKSFHKQLPPDTNKRRRKLLRRLRDPSGHSILRKPAARLNFLRVQRERPFMFASIHPNKLLTRFVTRINPQHSLRRALQSHP